MPIKMDDLICAPGLAPKLGQVSAPPVGQAGWSKQPVGDSEDLQRVLALPRRDQPTEAQGKILSEVMTKRFIRDRTGMPPCSCKKLRPTLQTPCITTLKPTQSWALLELQTTQGITGAIGVGEGKTLLGILAAMAMPNCRVALMLIPPRLVKQFVLDYVIASQHFRVPTLVVHTHDNVTRTAPGNAPVLHVMPYSKLSRKDATSFIAKIKPDFIFADEAHRLKDPGTATTSRVFRYLRDNPETRFAVWTGSLTDKSLKDFGHLTAASLRYGSPLPLDPETLKEWAGAIDPTKTFPAPAGALHAFCSEGQHVREGFSDRLLKTQGFIATSKSAVDAKMVIKQRKSPSIPSTILAALEMVRDGERPDGEILVEAADKSVCAKQVASGFYYRFCYPRGENESTIEAWFEARKAWNKELRDKLKPREEYLDSPLLCQEAAARFYNGTETDLPLWESEAWPLWRDIRDTVKPETETVWIDDYLARDAVEWAKSHRGVVWYSFTALGNKIVELSGLPLYAGGPGSDERIAAEQGKQSIVMSIQAHGEGTNGLQYLYDDQLFTYPPSSGKTWEQALGRLYRLGQESDIVTAEMYGHTEEFENALEEAKRRTSYAETLLKSEMKLALGLD